jgi:bifunctional non-homologous end joining protein LigD
MPKRRRVENSPMPKNVAPMLATLSKEPFNSPDYIYEVKWDGYRVVAIVDKEKVILQSRSQEYYTDRYKVVTQALQQLGHNAILDGEVVALDVDGKPSFNLLQKHRTAKPPLVYYVFDMLWLDGKDLTGMTLQERRAVLQGILPADSEVIKFSDAFDDGLALFEQMREMGMEGIVAKKKDSVYSAGIRSKSWLKVPIFHSREYVIGGWAESSSGRSFATLLIGEYQGKDLVYIHHSGSGLSGKQTQQLLERMKELEIKRSAFKNAKDVDRDTPVHWVKPVIVGRFEQSNKRTASGRIRHPVILTGLREDKQADEVGPEKAVAPPAAGDSTLEVDGRSIPVSDIGHAFWHGITKADVIAYYAKMFVYMAPYLKDRPLGLEIVKGVAAQGGEFIRNVAGLYPPWATIFQTQRKHPKPGKSRTIDWLVCNDVPTIVFIANLGSLDLHPWHSRTKSPDHPDYIVIDIDPSDDDFGKAVEVARAAKQYLDGLKLKAFIKTSGKTGLHILVPCSAIKWGESRTIGEILCGGIHELVPNITTLNTSVSSRGSKVYVDPSQNDYADRIAATYSLRAYKLPTISTPLDWKELRPSLQATVFTIDTIFKRLEKKGDLFEGLLGPATQRKNDRILRGLLI